VDRGDFGGDAIKYCKLGNLVRILSIHGRDETGVVCEFGLALIESEEFGGSEFEGAGDVKDVHGAASEVWGFCGKAQELLKKAGSIQMGRGVKTAFVALVKEVDLSFSIILADFFPEDFESQGVDEFRVKQVPDGDGEILRSDFLLDEF